MHRNGYGTNLSILSLGVVACLGACATDDGPREVLVVDPAWSTVGARAGAGADRVRPPEKPTAEPFQHEFPALITQTVRWASVDVRVTRARQLRGATGDGGELPRSLDPKQIYVQLELAIANKDIVEVDYRDRFTWDLKLADGTRLRSVNPLGVSVLPGDEATTVVYYEVDDVVDLRGAALVLEGEERGALEPEVLPLDVAYVPMFPLRLMSLVGRNGTFRPLHFPSAMAHVDEAVFDTNTARIGRANKDTRVVWLRIALTTGENSGVYAADELRIVIDGRASAPFKWDYNTFASGTTYVLFAAFRVPAGTQHFELALPNGAGIGDRFPVDLATDAVLATDIP